MRKRREGKEKERNRRNCNRNNELGCSILRRKGFWLKRRERKE